MLHDSGERKTNELGSQTDPSHAGVALELLSPYSIRDLAIIYGAGAKKYAPRNWEKGIQFSICVGKLKRHLDQYLMGKTEEDHLSAVGFWWHALAHYREMIKLGLLPASLDDLPKYEQQIPDGTSPGHDEQQDEEYGEFTIRKPWQAEGKGWCVTLTRAIGKRYGDKMFLHKDCKLHRGTGYRNHHKYAEAPGYFKSKAHAKGYIDCRRVRDKLLGGDYVGG